MLIICDHVCVEACVWDKIGFNKRCTFLSNDYLFIIANRENTLKLHCLGI